MISENLSHDSIILEENEDTQRNIWVMTVLLNLIRLDMIKDITYDVYKWIDPAIKSKGKENVVLKLVDLHNS